MKANALNDISLEISILNDEEFEIKVAHLCHHGSSLDVIESLISLNLGVGNSSIQEIGSIVSEDIGLIGRSKRLGEPPTAQFLRELRASAKGAKNDLFWTLKRLHESAKNIGVGLFQLKSMFERARSNGDSSDISQQDFIEVLSKQNLIMEAVDHKSIMEAFGSGRAGFVNYERFIRALQSQNTVSMDGFWARVQIAMKPNSVMKLREAFQGIDREAKGLLSCGDFQRIIQEFEPGFDTRLCDSLIARLSSSEEGCEWVDYRGFLTFLERPRRLLKGAIVVARLQDEGYFSPATIRRGHADGTFDVIFSNGVQHSRVKEQNIIEIGDCFSENEIGFDFERRGRQSSFNALSHESNGASPLFGKEIGADFVRLGNSSAKGASDNKVDDGIPHSGNLVGSDFELRRHDDPSFDPLRYGAKAGDVGRSPHSDQDIGTDFAHRNKPAAGKGVKMEHRLEENGQVSDPGTSLLGGWSKRFSRTFGTHYFYHEASDASSWSPPSVGQGTENVAIGSSCGGDFLRTGLPDDSPKNGMQKGQRTENAELPPGWRRRRSSFYGDDFYINDSKQVASWLHPADGMSLPLGFTDQETTEPTDQETTEPPLGAGAMFEKTRRLPALKQPDLSSGQHTAGMLTSLDSGHNGNISQTGGSQWGDFVKRRPDSSDSNSYDIAVSQEEMKEGYRDKKREDVGNDFKLVGHIRESQALDEDDDAKAFSIDAGSEGDHHRAKKKKKKKKKDIGRDFTKLSHAEIELASTIEESDDGGKSGKGEDHRRHPKKKNVGKDFTRIDHTSSPSESLRKKSEFGHQGLQGVPSPSDVPTVGAEGYGAGHRQREQDTVGKDFTKIDHSDFLSASPRKQSEDNDEELRKIGSPSSSDVADRERRHKKNKDVGKNFTKVFSPPLEAPPSEPAPRPRQRPAPIKKQTSFISSLPTLGSFTEENESTADDTSSALASPDVAIGSNFTVIKKPPPRETHAASEGQSPSTISSASLLAPISKPVLPDLQKKTVSGKAVAVLAPLQAPKFHTPSRVPSQREESEDELASESSSKSSTQGKDQTASESAQAPTVQEPTANAPTVQAPIEATAPEPVKLDPEREAGLRVWGILNAHLAKKDSKAAFLELDTYHVGLVDQVDFIAWALKSLGVANKGDAATLWEFVVRAAEGEAVAPMSSGAAAAAENKNEPGISPGCWVESPLDKAGLSAVVLTRDSFKLAVSRRTLEISLSTP